MGTYDRQIATARRLITAKGQLCVYRSILDPVNEPLPTGSPYTDYLGTPIVFLPYGGSNFGGSSYIQMLFETLKGTEVATGKGYALMPGDVPFTPTLKDLVFRDGIGGDALRVIKADHLSPNGQSVLWALALNR